MAEILYSFRERLGQGYCVLLLVMGPRASRVCDECGFNIQRNKLLLEDAPAYEPRVRSPAYTLTELDIRGYCMAQSLLPLYRVIICPLRSAAGLQ